MRAVCIEGSPVLVMAWNNLVSTVVTDCKVKLDLIQQWD